MLRNQEISRTKVRKDRGRQIRHPHLPEDHAGTPALAACTEGCSGPLDDEDGCAALPWYHTKLCLSALLRQKKGERLVAAWPAALRAGPRALQQQQELSPPAQPDSHSHVPSPEKATHRFWLALTHTPPFPVPSFLSLALTEASWRQGMI